MTSQTRSLALGKTLKNSFSEAKYEETVQFLESIIGTFTFIDTYFSLLFVVYVWFVRPQMKNGAVDIECLLDNYSLNAFHTYYYLLFWLRISQKKKFLQKGCLPAELWLLDYRLGQ